MCVQVMHWVIQWVCFAIWWKNNRYDYQVIVRTDDEYNYYILVEFFLPCNGWKNRYHVTPACDSGM